MQNQLIGQVEKISDAFKEVLVTNGDQKVYQGNSLYVKFGETTYLQTQNQLFGSSSGLKSESQDNQQKKIRNQIFEEEIFEDGEFNIYQTQQKIYNFNPYPKSGQNKDGEDYKNFGDIIHDYKIEIQKQQNQKQQNLKLKKSLEYEFKSKQQQEQDSKNNTKKYEKICIQRINNKWEDSNCQQINRNLPDGQIQTICQCDILAPTTIADNVVSTIDQVFEDSKLDDIFSEKGVEKLKDFKFQESLVVYAFSTFTVLYLILLREAKALDIVSKEDQQENEKLLNENNNQNLQDNIIEIEDKKDLSKDGDTNKMNDQDQMQQSYNVGNNIETKSNFSRKRNKNKKSKFRNFLNEQQQSNDDKTNLEEEEQQSNQKEQDKLRNSKQFSKKSQDNIKVSSQENIQDDKDIKIQQDEYMLEIMTGNKIEDELNQNQEEYTKSNEQQTTQKQESENLSEEKNTENSTKEKTQEEIIDEKIQNMDEVEKEKFNQKLMRQGIWQGIFIPHSFFGIFLSYDPKLSRTKRITIFYVGILLLLASSSIFQQNGIGQLYAIIFSSVIAAFINIPLGIINFLIKHKKPLLNKIGFILTFIIGIGSIYMTVVSAAILGVKDSNTWVKQFFTVFLIDQMFTQTIKNIITVISIKKTMQTGKNSIFSKIFKNEYVSQFFYESSISH